MADKRRLETLKMRNNTINTTNITTMKTIYISGKIAGLEMLDVKRKFDLAKQHLEHQGWGIVLNPLRITRFPNFTWADYLIRDLLYLAKCDAIYMLSDWQDSPGARVEHEFAKGLGIEIIYQDKTTRL